MKRKELNIGDEVITDGYSGFCDRCKTTIFNIKTKYDENTGKPYKVYIIETGQEFDGRTGFAITCPTAYFIEELIN